MKRHNAYIPLATGIILLIMAGAFAFASSTPGVRSTAERPHALLRESAKLDAQLLRAAEQDDSSQALLLLKKSASAKAAQADGTTVLHWAAYNDNVALAKALIHAGADPNARTRVRGVTPLHMAAETGDSALIEVLLKAGANVGATNELGTTPLMIASASGSTGAVDLLLAQGADVNSRDKTFGETPLMFAASHDRGEVVRLLLSRGADPKTVTSISKLERVTLGVNGEVQDDKKPTEAGAPAHASNASGSADKPADSGGVNKESSKADKGDSDKGENADKPAAKPDDKTKDAYGFTAADRKKRVYGTLQIGGMTALLIAARDGQQAAVKALLDAHDDVNQTSGTDHATPLILALINGHYDLAKLLLDRGANPKLATTDGVAPLYVLLDVQWAPHTWYPQPVVSREHIPYLDLAKALLAHGADPNAVIKKKLWYRVFANDETWFELDGATPFLRASLASDLAAMRLLVENGADPNLKTASGDTPLMAAAGIGWAAYWTSNAPYARLDAVKFCLDHGADLKATDAKGYTALHGAAFRGDNEMANYLLSLGADIHARTKDGDTVADFANGLFEHAMVHPETVALLEQKGSVNSHNCRSNECVVPPKEDKAVATAKVEKPTSATTQAQPEVSQESKQK